MMFCCFPDPCSNTETSTSQTDSPAATETATQPSATTDSVTTEIATQSNDSTTTEIITQSINVSETPMTESQTVTGEQGTQSENPTSTPSPTEQTTLNITVNDTIATTPGTNSVNLIRITIKACVYFFINFLELHSIVLFTEPVNCTGNPNWVMYTDYTVEGRSPGDRAVYVCMVGVRFIDGTTSRSVVCQSDGTWEELKEGPQCKYDH